MAKKRKNLLKKKITLSQIIGYLGALLASVFGVILFWNIVQLVQDSFNLSRIEWIIISLIILTILGLLKVKNASIKKYLGIK